jgi:head-tail adaptor
MFRHPATVCKPSSSVGSVDARGAVTPSSTERWKIHVRIDSLAGDEGAYARTLYPTATYLLTARYDSRLTERCRVVVSGTTLHVLGITNVNLENREMLLTCGEER